MKVRMTIDYYDKKNTKIPYYDNLTIKVKFKFVLKPVTKQILNQYDTFSLDETWEDNNTLSESDFMILEKGKIYFHHFYNTTWLYNSDMQEVYIVNQTIKI